MVFNKENSLGIKFDKLREVIEKCVRGHWGSTEGDWQMRPGGGETYLQEKVLKKASPYLTEKSLRTNAKESVLSALKAHVNLLSQYELMFANIFVENAPEAKLREHFVSLFGGPEQLPIRLKRFLGWAKIEPVPDKKMKKGINGTVCSYLLTIFNPAEYAFCKPVTYSSAVTELIKDKKAKKTDPVERIVHCREFYLFVLEFLRKEYGHQDTNLLDVHSLFYFLQSKDEKSGLPRWKGCQSPPPPPPEVPLPSRNTILYGPPGTGKTYALRNEYMKRFTGSQVVTREQFTQELAGVTKRYEFVTFHQSYSYEDFVEGIKPVMSEDVTATMTYEVKPGIFRTMVERALADPNHDYALLIDEINRGNVASIFGELIALIEDDKRKGAENELRAQLPYSRQEFVVPGNFYIIGAMNTADRGVEALDTALRRRFTFIAIPPQPELIEQPGNLEVDLRALLVTINARIEKLLDKDHCIGHSYFMGIARKAEPLDELRKVFATRIMPLLEEYFYGDPAKIGMVLGERFVERKDQAIEWAAGDWGMDEFEERRVYALQDPMNLKVEDFRAVYE
jgi:hypothetical protein